MSNKTPAVIATVLTVVLLGITALVLTFTQMLLLNGASERQGMSALGISLVCQGTGLILAAILAWRLTGLFIAKLNWNKFLSVALAVTAGTVAGGGLSFLALIVGTIAAGIR
ncbi:MAG: hypothetical protein HY869_22400 [Chloroflexi bacterium]|nr:hypothetical protein [Chloroflexota bacterium]